jgi:hypothetical protein
MSRVKGWNTSRLTPSDLSALKRCAGKMIGQANAGALMSFYRAAGTAAISPEECSFAALSISMLWRESDHPKVRPMEEILRDMLQANTPEENLGLMNRVRATLDTKWAKDGFLLGKIANLSRIIRTAHPDWAPDAILLTKDIRDWNLENRSVQRRWIRVIFTDAQTEPEIQQEDQGGYLEC